MEDKERIVCKDGGITMEFRQLEYFCTISELENFTRTAKVLHVSQPSVTKAIKALEAELGLTLIDRSQKHVTLTDAGRAFLIHARRIMQDAEIAKQDMMRFCVGSAGTVHFGVPPMFEARICDMRYGLTSTLSCAVMLNVIGTVRRTVVTLSRNAEQTIVSAESATSREMGRALTFLADQMARKLKSPVSLVMLTIIIMPMSRPSVLKSMWRMAVS